MADASKKPVAFRVPKKPAITSVVNAKVVGEDAEREVLHQTQELPLPEDLPEHCAMVGNSASVGRSSEFAREKFEVSTWVTLPCAPTEEAVHATLEVAQEMATRANRDLLRKVVTRFFPGMDGIDEMLKTNF